MLAPRIFVILSVNWRKPKFLSRPTLLTNYVPLLANYDIAAQFYLKRKQKIKIGLTCCINFVVRAHNFRRNGEKWATFGGNEAKAVINILVNEHPVASSPVPSNIYSRLLFQMQPCVIVLTTYRCDAEF